MKVRDRSRKWSRQADRIIYMNKISMQLKSVKNAVIRQINILCPQDQPKQLTQKKHIILKTYSKKKMKETPIIIY